MAEIIDSADLDEDQQTRLEREFAREYQLITGKIVWTRSPRISSPTTWGVVC